MRYSVLTSGSCGNSYAFYDGKDTILIDCGLSFSGLIRRLEDANIPQDSLRSLFVTHMHPDHHKGVGVFKRKTGLPIYMSKESVDANKRLIIGNLKLDTSDINQFDYLEKIQIGDFLITPISTFHDANGSCCYKIEHPELSMFLLTDCGEYTPEILENAKGCKIIFLESNYDEEMLDKGPYPYPLKARVKGRYGHLSNDQANNFLQSLPEEEKKVYFIHLSTNNNTPDKVLDLSRRTLGKHIDFHVCERGQSVTGNYGKE